MAGQPRLVNKQFNSPIGLYSEANVRDIIDRESQMLSNGVVGIDFHQPMTAKPANLQNSAVLRMLEEEESRQRNGQSGGAKRVAWPPPKEGDDDFLQHDATEGEEQACFSPPPQRAVQPQPQPSQQVAQNQQQRHQQAPPAPGSVWAGSQPQRAAPPSPLLLQQAYQQPNQQPAPVFPQANPIRPLSPQPFSPVAVHQPQWASVQPQVTSTRLPQSPSPATPQYQYQQAPPSQGQNYQEQPQPQTQYQQQPTQVKAFEPPPSTITLRPQAPVRQAPAPIITSQPATATLKGGRNLRGDMKWPPENVKDRMQAENQARVDLAKGPAFRPRRVDKDYSGFFAQHALNSTYPGYKVPPGTQYYEHHPVM